MSGGKGAQGKQRLPAAYEDGPMKEREFCVTVIFSILSRSKMIDDAGGVIFPHEVHSSHIAHTIAWEDGSFDYYDIKDEEKKPEEKRVIRKTIYIDCGDLKMNPAKIVNPDSKQMLEKLKRAAEVTKGFLDINTAKGYKGTVHFIICGYSPAEALVYAFDMLVRKKTPSQKMYQEFISSIPDNYLKTFDPYTDSEEAFSFEVDYRCVYAGYCYQSPMPEDPYAKQRHIEKKLQELKDQQNVNSGSSWSRASADWEYLDRTEQAKGHVAGIDYPRRDQVEYKGKFWTKEELSEELERVKKINLEKKTAADEYESLSQYKKEEIKVNQARDEYFRVSKKNKYKINEISDLEKQLHDQQYVEDSDASYAYYQGLTLHEEDGIQKDYHDINTIEFESEYITLSELYEIKNELESQIEKAGNHVLDVEADAVKAMDKADREELMKTLKIIQMAAGIGSLVIGPLAIIDLVIEAYSMIQDGDLSHLWAIGADAIAVFPLVGGIASKAIKGIAKYREATTMSNIVYDGVKAGEQLNSTVGLAGRVEQTVKAGEEGKNLYTLRGTGVWVSEETASVGSKMSSYVKKEQAYSSYLSAENVSTQASKEAKAAEEAYNNAKIANKAAYDKAYNEAYEKSIQKMLAEEGSYRGVTKEMQEAVERKAKEVADATLKATEIKAVKEAAAKKAAEEAAEAKKTAEVTDHFMVAYEGNIDKVTVMKGRLDIIRKEHWKQRNELGKMLYEGTKSKVSIVGFVQDATSFISNFGKLNAKSKAWGSYVLLKDSYSNYYTVKGIVENGYAVYKF